VNNPLEIVVLNWRDLRSPQAGGAEVHVHEVFGRIAALGHRVRLVSTRYPGLARTEMIGGVEVLRVGNRAVPHLAIPLAARKLCVGSRVDAVVDCINKLPFFSPLYVRAPVLAIVHHLPGTSAFREAPFPLAAGVCLSELGIPRVYGRTPVLAISASTKQDLVARGLDANRIRIVDLGVDHSIHCPNGRLTSPKSPLVLHVGRVRRYKQVDHVIRMMEQVRHVVPGARLAIVGEGADEPRLRRLAHRLDLSGAVTFAGYLSETEKVDWIRRASVVVCASIKEGWGLTVIEANACGVPVVAYDAPGLRDSVRPETGILVPQGDIAALADATVRLLTQETMRTELGREAVNWAGRFSWERCAQETLALIQEVITAHRAEKGDSGHA